MVQIPTIAEVRLGSTTSTIGTIGIKMISSSMYVYGLNLKLTCQLDDLAGCTWFGCMSLVLDK